AADGSKNYLPRKTRAAQRNCCAALPTSSVSILGQAERLQRWLIDRRSDRKTIVGLERRQRPACLRPKESIALLLQCQLHVFDDPIRRPVRTTGVDRSVVRIPSVRVVAPGGIPVADVPVPPSAQHKDYARVVRYPPAAVMPYAVVIVERDVVPTAETIVSPIVNDAHVSVAIQRHIAREGEISLLVHRQVPGCRPRDISLRSAGSVDSSCFCTVVPHGVRASNPSLTING